MTKCPQCGYESAEDLLAQRMRACRDEMYALWMDNKSLRGGFPGVARHAAQFADARAQKVYDALIYATSPQGPKP